MVGHFEGLLRRSLPIASKLFPYHCVCFSFGGGVAEVMYGEWAAAGVAEEAEDAPVLHLLLHLQRRRRRGHIDVISPPLQSRWI